MAAVTARFGGAIRGSMLAAVLLAVGTFAGNAEETASVAGPDLPLAEYERVSQQISLSAERIASLSAEIATIKKDQATITAALIQSAKTERKLSQDIEDITDRVEALKLQEADVKRSLAGRRGVLA